MKTQIEEVNIRMMLWRLRYGSEYQWLGGSADTGHTMNDIGEWRDQLTTPPTAAELIAEQNIYDTEQIGKPDETTTDTEEKRVIAARGDVDVDLAKIIPASQQSQMLLEMLANERAARQQLEARVLALEGR